MEVKDQSREVLGMSLEFRSFQLSELQFRHYLEMISNR
jgi:hypothetical protein